jgi:hypothetical protein
LLLILAGSTTVALAAEVLIEGSANTTAAVHGNAGNTNVFISDDTGYSFYAGSDGTCYYRKTTDSGSTWGSAVQFANLTDCSNVSVWYDQWTPGDTGTSIHIVTMHVSSNSLRYNRLDTGSDTLLLGASPVVATSGQTPTLSVGANVPTITKGTDGTIYVAISDNADAFVQECTTSCNLTGSWSETGTNPMDTSIGDMQLLLPLLGGDILLISRQRTSDDILSKVWDNTSWDASWTIIASNAPESSAYELALSAVTNPNTGRVHLAYVADHNNFSQADHDIRTAYYDSGTWTAGADIITNDSRGLTEVALALDVNTGEVYVAYGARSAIANAATTDIYWASSSASMASWGSENGPLNIGQDDFYGLSTNHLSNQRLYVTWYEAATDDVRGETMLDTTPPLTVSATGVQITEVRGGTNNVYVGGAFIFTEFGAGRDVTSITITESGSVDGANDLDNIRLLYDVDTSAPHDCASESYEGDELQFGATDTNGFSGSDGVATFADTVSVSTSTPLCVYVLFDVLDTAADGQTIDISIDNPSTDVLVTGAFSAQPVSTVVPSGLTTVVYPQLVQHGYHWRNNDGSEVTATSRTGGSENTQLNDLARSTPVRLRLGAYNNGSTSTVNSSLQLEYGVANPSCSSIGTWISVDASPDAWDMFDSAQLTHGANTTDIATSSGGITNAVGTTFVTSNNGVRDTNSATAALSIDTNAFVEYEFSLLASSTATQGATYCFRLTEGGTPMSYTQYPSVLIAADVNVSAAGTQIAGTEIGNTNIYAGGTFVVTEGAASRTVSTIIIHETGSIDASTDLSNIELYYDLDEIAPYDCATESYDGTEPQYGSTVVSGFNAPNGSAAFSDSVSISPTSALCLYVVYDVDTSAQNGETVDFEISNPSTDITVSGGAAVAPASPIALAGSTPVTGAIVSQVHYHWRNDDGTETGATSATAGSEDTAITDLSRNEVYRLRIGLSNEGGTSTPPVQYQLQYGTKVTSCDVIASWTNVGDTVNDAWDMFDSTFLTHGEDTTDIPISNGGVSDEESAYLTPNQGVRDIVDMTATTTIGSTNYVDYEFAITTTGNTPFDTEYCFRLIENGQPLTAYTVYPEAAIRENRDFKVQRGIETVSGTSLTLTAGVDYDAPAATSAAFIRITNAHGTGAGNDSSGNQNPDDVTAYISTSDLTSSFTINRDTDSINNTRVAWEIIEFIGPVGTDNEMIVRDVGTLTLGTGVLQATGTATAVTDDTDVVVFVTGVGLTTNLRNEYDNGLVTTDWSSGTNQPVITRDTADQEVTVGYAVVEFVGENWRVQRVEHQFVGAGSAEPVPITPVSSLTKAFVEGQKRMTSFSDQASYGVQIWLSSIGAVSFYLDPGASTPSSHTAVAWVIENTQSGGGEMVVFSSSGSTAGGTEPLTDFVTFDGGGVNDTSNASIFAFATLDQTSNSFPQVMAGFSIASSTDFELYRSDTGGTLSYRTTVVQWPAADVAIRQNYYRWYDNQNALTPTNPWPPTGGDIGENTAITPLDTPVGDGDVLRLRMSYRVSNGSLAAGLETLKLQYGFLGANPSCSAIASWNDVGAPGSGAVWRGFDNGGVAEGAAVGSNPPTGGQVLLSVSDRAGRYVEDGSAVANPYQVFTDEDVEYDWVIQHNGAVQRSDYCFRTVLASGVELDGYLNYPQLRTQGYFPRQSDWRWYTDENEVTPVDDLAAENTAPIEVKKGDALKLRVLIEETNNLPQTDARFRLQYATQPDFSDVAEVVSSGSCGGSDPWCYADGAGLDNATITNAVLTNADSCSGGVGVGCGTHSESNAVLTGFTHAALASTEYEFTIQYQEVTGFLGQVWYFRIYDSVNNDVVDPAELATFPSLVGDSGSITFSVTGLPSGTTTEGLLTNATTTPTTIAFGDLIPEQDVRVAQRLTVDTTAVNGYQVFLYKRQALQNETADTIHTIAGTNETPVSWSVGCAGLPSCFGYHAGDDTLAGNAGRFALDDTFTAPSTTPEEIMYNALAATESEDILFRIVVGGTQAPGDYTTNLVYLVTPQF